MTKQEIREEWIRRLESGTIEQGKRFLGTPDGTRCCMGVLCDLAVEQGVIPSPTTFEESNQWVRPRPRLIYGPPGDTTMKTLPVAVTRWAGLCYANGGVAGLSEDEGDKTLTAMNDQGKSFTEIAQVLRNHPDHYFTEISDGK